MEIAIFLISSHVSVQQYIKIGLSLAPHRRQAIAWTSYKE